MGRNQLLLRRNQVNATIMMYVHNGTIIHTTTDEPRPQPNQEVGFISPDGVSRWIIQDVHSEHIDTLGGDIVRANCQPLH